jgi:hypothetical protein
VERVLREVQRGVSNVADWPTAARANVLLDLAEAASCSCGGDRSAMEEREPPRSVTPIVMAPVGLDLAAASYPTSRPLAAAEAVETAPPPPKATGPVTPPEPPHDRFGRATAVSVARTDLAARPTRRAPRIAVRRVPARWSRALVLATIPAVVLGGVAALGVAAYGLTSGGPGGRPATAAAAGEPAPAARKETAAPTALRHAPSDSIATLPAMVPPFVPRGAGEGGASPAPPPVADSSRVRSDTARVVIPRQPRRPRAPEVVPGWLPQGAKTWTPRDTNRAEKPDSGPMPRARPDTVPRA